MASNLTPTVAGRKMSSSLKERLKRTSRYFKSPVLNTAENEKSETKEKCALRPCESDSNLNTPQSSHSVRKSLGDWKKVLNMDGVHIPNVSCSNSSTCDKDVDNSGFDLKDKEVLQEEIKKKEDIVRKLNMVKMYRSKNDLEALQTLIDKWKRVSQEALEELVELTTIEPRPSLKQLIDHLQIEYSMVDFNPEDECFL